MVPPPSFAPESPSMTPLLALLALLIEAAAGYPDLAFRTIRHPVVWIGALIGALDRRLNDPRLPEPRRRRRGVVALALVLAAAILPSAALAAAASGVAGLLLLAVLGSSLLAQRSLDAHVAAVAAALETGGLAAGRTAVARIVGRDPESLDVAGVARAAVESLAENFSDGVVAPAFWLALAGLPGGAAYKAVNTADSMIGHLDDRHRAFGRAAARLDDLLNLPASRLAALLLVAAAVLTPGASPCRALTAVRHDAHRHRSPNAGWPEAAMAGALGLALAGPRSYGGVIVEDAVMGAGGRRELDATDIRRALRLFRAADVLLVGLIAIWALAVTLPG
jgi:adenosylcobinamide-phosphate synthase